MVDEAVQIAFLVKGRVKINVENFGAILQKVGQRPVCIVSINGPTRTGKSYMLGHFLRYFNSSDKSNGDWFHQTLKSQFHWKSSSDRQTTGIMMWSKPYFVQKEDEEIGVLLMDTQGCFDSHTTTAENSFIFSLSCLFSSVLIYNVRQQVAEDALQNLQLFLEYSKLVLDDPSAQASSKLILLIRDWEVPDDYAYGYYSDKYTCAASGRNYKTERMDVQSTMPEEVKVVHREILSGFTSVECDLLPHPGLEFAKGVRSDKLESDFVYGVVDFVPRVLGPDGIVKKTVCGNEVTGQDLLELVKKWARLFASCDMPAAKNVAEAAAEVQFTKAHMFALKVYKNAMHIAAVDEKTSVETLAQKHQSAQQDARQIFHKMKGVKHKEAEPRFRESLEADMEHSYTLYQEIHACKQNSRNQQKMDAEIARQRQILEQEKMKAEMEMKEYLLKAQKMDAEKEKQRILEQKKLEDKLKEMEMQRFREAQKQQQEFAEKQEALHQIERGILMKTLEQKNQELKSKWSCVVM